MAGSSMQVFYR